MIVSDRSSLRRSMVSSYPTIVKREHGIRTMPKIRNERSIGDRHVYDTYTETIPVRILCIFVRAWKGGSRAQLVASWPAVVSRLWLWRRVYGTICIRDSAKKHLTFNDSICDRMFNLHADAHGYLGSWYYRVKKKKLTMLFTRPYAKMIMFDIAFELSLNWKTTYACICMVSICNTRYDTIVLLLIQITHRVHSVLRENGDEFTARL